MEEKKMNVYQKLLKARADFLAAKVKKSGKNQHLKFDYFELDDIVPVATRIFSEVGLLPVVCFDGELATMRMVDADCPEDYITFTSPVVALTQNGMNAVQALGATETYQRRYLYYMALDICEPDALDRDQPQQPAKRPAARQSAKAPASATKAPKKQAEPIISAETADEICKHMEEALGRDRASFLTWVPQKWGKKLEEMDGNEAAVVWKWIDQQAAKRKAKEEQNNA